MDKKDLWGEIEKTIAPKNPKVILKEQADIIGVKTKYVLSGKVLSSSETKGNRPSFTCSLRILASKINNYTYDLLLIEYPLEMYPLKLHSLLDGQAYTCNTEEEFIGKLGGILSSEEVMKTLSALVSQSTA